MNENGYMIRKDFERRMAKTFDVPLCQAEKAVEMFLTTLKDCIREKKEVYILSEFQLKIKDVPATKRFNPKKKAQGIHEEAEVPAHTKVRIRLMKNFKDAANGK
jgi:nucleoid DNA-binding protein